MGEETEVENTPLTMRRVYKWGSSAVVIIVGLWALHQWVGLHLEVHLLSRADAAELKDQISQVAAAAKEASTAAMQASQAAAQTSEALSMYIVQQELKNARDRLSALQGQLSETQLWEASNKANDISRARKLDLERQIQALKEQVECLKQGRLVSVCQN